MGFSINVAISFGHCDPAGIVYYPNYFRWFDRCFHSFLAARAGGHRALCRDLGSRGLGLMDVQARFPSPAVNDDMMELEIQGIDWSARTFTVRYEGRVEGRPVVQGHELRGLFVERDGRMRAGEVAPLRARLGADAG